MSTLRGLILVEELSSSNAYTVHRLMDLNVLQVASNDFCTYNAVV